MFENIPAEIIKSVSSSALKYFKELNKSKEEHIDWVSLFTNTGDECKKIFTTNEDIRADIESVFSDNNMKCLADKVKSVSGFNLMEEIHDELYRVFLKNDVDTILAEQCMQVFINNFIELLKLNDQERSVEVFLTDFKKNIDKEFCDVIDKLNYIMESLNQFEDKEDLYSIEDIERMILNTSKYPKLSLDFYEVDDSNFREKFHEQIEEVVVFVSGECREEILLRILNLLRKEYKDKSVLVVTSQKQWEAMRNYNIKDFVLIPYFHADSINAIADNHNVFIYGQDDPQQNDAIELRKRTRQSFLRTLEYIGINYSEAYKMVDSTSGLHFAMKEKLYNMASYAKPEWAAKPTANVLAALLCGKWTENEGDKVILELLSRESYEDFHNEINNLSMGEKPYCINQDYYSNHYKKIACIEESWMYLDKYIDNDLWNDFNELFCYVLSIPEPIFNFPIKEHLYRGINVSEKEFSKQIKIGMIRTLIMRRYYCKNDLEYSIDNMVKRVLDSVDSGNKLAYISQYMCDLCEAAPNVVLCYLEELFQNTPEYFENIINDDSKDFLLGRHYYTNIFFAIEQLLQDRKYIKRSVELLFRINELDIDYNSGNIPEKILNKVFCAWINLTPLKAEEKTLFAKEYVKKYPLAWNIIENALPDSQESICSNLSTPKYKVIDDIETLTVKDAYDTYIDYLKICMEYAKGDVNKWKSIVIESTYYSEDIIKNVMGELLSHIKLNCDEDVYIIKEAIRDIIYRHRRYANADWSMDEEKISIYESCFNKLSYNMTEYNYVYLFDYDYNICIINPCVYTENEEMDELDAYIADYLKKQFDLLKLDKKADILKLIQITLNHNKEFAYYIGEKLSKYYFNEKAEMVLVLKLLDESDQNLHSVAFYYLKNMVFMGKADLNKIVDILEKECVDNRFIAKVIGLEYINNKDTSIISKKTKPTQKLYWTSIKHINISDSVDEDTFSWILDNILYYRRYDLYLNYLFNSMNIISIESLYEHFIKLLDIEMTKFNTMDSYYFKAILKALQKEYKNDNEKCMQIATIEWIYGALIEWDDMKCMQIQIKRDPALYAALIRLIYKKDDGTIEDESDNIDRTAIYSRYMYMKFCPCEKNGKVDFEELKKWMEDFSQMLTEQNQKSLYYHIIGKLLANSPIGSDGYDPCEAVRHIVEECHNEDMMRSYVIEVRNQRGVYTYDNGKSEHELYLKYKNMADHLKLEYPYTAEIYYRLGDMYFTDSEQERKRAENEF